MTTFAQHRARRGVTLIEMMVATLIVFMLLASLTTMFVTATRVYQVRVGESIAQREAAWASYLIALFLRPASLVADNGETYIVFYLPQWDHDVNRPKVPMSSFRKGTKLTIYRGNSRGEPTSAGTYLWLARYDASTDTFVPEKMITDCLDYIHFEYFDKKDHVVHYNLTDEDKLLEIRTVRVVLRTAATQLTTGGIVGAGRSHFGTVDTQIFLRNSALT